jgi:hypothetical protein
MKKTVRRVSGTIAVSMVLLLGVCALAQDKQVRSEKRPSDAVQDKAAQDNADASNATTPKTPSYEYFSILDGLPMTMKLHHDTEVGSNKPIWVYEFVIELQVMNSDGNFEPIGLQIHNFYTAKAQKPQTAFNPHNAHDCGTWNKLIVSELQNRNPTDATWPYVEFVVAKGARTLQTNEHGRVWWSDDVECWGSQDRFPPF